MSSASLRLAFVATLPEHGGAAAHLADLVRSLVDARHHVSVVADPSSDLWRTLRDHGGVRLTAVSHRSTSTREKRARILAAIAENCAEAVFSTFECDYWDTGFVARRAGVPAALFLHHAGMKRANRWLLPLAPWHVLVPSHDLRRWVLGLGVRAEAIHVLYNAVDTDVFAPDSARRACAREKLGYTPDEVVVGFVGRIESNKGVLPLAQACNRAMRAQPQLRSLWVGSGRLEREVDAILAQAPEAAHHRRVAWTTSVREYYAAMDLLVLPSVRRESFGRVLLEAQASQIPVIASQIGGIPEAVSADASALLVPPGDVNALTSAIEALASDRDRRAAMGAAGRAFVQTHFDRTLVAPAFSSWFTRWREIVTTR